MGRVLDRTGHLERYWRRAETLALIDFSSRSFCSVCGSTLGSIDDEPVFALVLGVFDSSNGKALCGTVTIDIKA